MQSLYQTKPIYHTKLHTIFSVSIRAYSLTKRALMMIALTFLTLNDKLLNSFLLSDKVRSKINCRHSMMMK